MAAELMQEQAGRRGLRHYLTSLPAAALATVVLSLSPAGPGAQAHATTLRAAVGPAAGRQLAELVGSDTVAGDMFGLSVAVSGSTVLIGAPGYGAIPHDGNATAVGRAYVFTKAPTGWRQTAELVGADTAVADMFGWSVAVSGNTAVVGAPWHADQAGRAYVFTKAPTGWRQAAELVGSDTAHDDYFGLSVAISGSTYSPRLSSGVSARMVCNAG